MNEPTKAELLKVVAEAMNWQINGQVIALSLSGSYSTGATLDNDTDLGNQIAIAQMMLWLQKNADAFEVCGWNNGKWFVDYAGDGSGTVGGDKPLCQALAMAVYVVAKEQTQ